MRTKLLKFSFALVWLAALTGIQPVLAQGPPPAEVSQAQSLFQAKDYDGAIKTLEEYFQHNTNAMTGLLLLGNAYRQKGEPDKALAAYLKATQARQMRPQALFNAAGLQASKGATDEAFKLLQQLRDTGNYDLDMVKASDDFKGTRAGESSSREPRTSLTLSSSRSKSFTNG